MIKDEMELYNDWDSMVNHFDERSQFNSLPPIGIGTIEVESLTSYIKRLCKSHHIPVRKFFSMTIIPRVSDRSSGNKLSSIIRKSSAIYSTTSTAEILVKELESLTLREGLQSLTFSNFNSFFSPNDTRSKKVWCPMCLEEMKNNGLIPYEKLIWGIKWITVCVEHNCYLVHSCPKCKKQISPLTGDDSVGFCSFCSNWLGKQVKDNIAEEELEWQQWILFNLEHMFSLSNKEMKKLYDSLNFSQKLKYIASELYKGFGLHRVGFAKILKINSVTLHDWINIRTTPSLGSIMRISYCIQTSIIDIAKDEFQNNRITILRQLVEQTPKQKAIRRSEIYPTNEEIGIELRKIIDSSEEPPPSFHEVLRRLGFAEGSGTRIREKYPDEVDIIVRRAKEYRREQALKNRVATNRIVRHEVSKLVQGGEYPSRRRVEKAIGKKGVLRDQKYHKVYRDQMEKLGIDYVKQNQY